MAPITDHTTRIPSGVASRATTNHAANGSVFVNLRNFGDWVAVPAAPRLPGETEFFIDNLLVRVLFIIEIIGWTGLEPWEFELSFQVAL